MPLAFPTQAEAAVEQFRSATKTISLVTICKAMKAERKDIWPKIIEYTFDDNSSLRISGVGASHKVTTHLP